MGDRRFDVPASLNALSERVIGAAIEVHRGLGPGMLEGIYEEAFVHELGLRGIEVQTQVELPLRYKGVVLRGQRLDLLVERMLIIEIKAVESVAEVHLAQLVSYLRAAELQLGLLINFCCPRLVDGVHRRINSRASGSPFCAPAPSANTLRPLR